MANKVKYNLKNVHYAPITSSGYGAVAPIPGAVSLSLDAQGDISKFYADGRVYYQSAPNNGYDGSIEIALVPDSFRKDILMEEVDKNGLLVEKSGVEFKGFALGFQIDGDAKNRFYWFYNCAASRPSVSGQTNTDSKEPQTETLSISCTANEDGYVRVRSTDDCTLTETTWFASVQEPSFV